MQSQKKIKILIAAVVIFVLVFNISLILILSKNNNLKQTVGNKSQSSFGIFSTPTPIPFAELTIPYLREREYISALGDLEKSSENQNYSAYITSYNSDGLKIYGLLTKPKNQMPAGGWPAVIFVHGYIPPNQYQTVQQYYDYVDYLARNDLVVFKIDLRGHGNSEGESSGAYYSSDYIIDVLNAYSALQNSSFVNPKKIGLWGHSMAGNVVMRSLAAQPTIPAIVIWAGAGYSYSDLESYGIDDNSYQPPQISSERAKKRQELFETYGQFSEENDFWKQVVSTNYLKDIKGKIQLHHATNDNVVSIEYSRNLNKLLDSTSIVHELNEYSTGGHNLTGNSFNQAMEKTVNFFK